MINYWMILKCKKVYSEQRIEKKVWYSSKKVGYKNNYLTNY